MLDEVLAYIEVALGLFCSFLWSKTSIHNTQNANSLQGLEYKLQTMVAESKSSGKWAEGWTGSGNGILGDVAIRGSSMLLEVTPHLQSST